MMEEEEEKEREIRHGQLDYVKRTPLAKMDKPNLERLGLPVSRR
jgi:hypothetical protein